MYKLATAYLAGILALAFALSVAGYLPYPAHYFLSAVFLTASCALVNPLFAQLAGARDNKWSALITGLILSLIVGPLSLASNLPLLVFLVLAAMGVKYLLAWKGTHLFNPAAIALVLSAFLLGQGASWWVGSSLLFPLVLAGGLLLSFKVRSLQMVSAFLIPFLFASFLSSGSLDLLSQLLLSSPILFFAFVMLPEPRTSPAQGHHKIWYGLLVAAAALFLQSHTAFSLELALLAGNLFAFALAGNFTRKGKV